MKNLQNINIFILIILLCSLFLPNGIINILFGLYCFVNILILMFNKTKPKIDNFFYIYFILILYLIFNLTLQAPFQDNNKFWRFIPILSFGILIFSNTKNFPIEKFKKFSIISCLIYIIICLIKTFFFYENHSFLPFGNGEDINQILSKDRPYVGFYIIINSILVFSEILKNKKNRIINIFIFFIFFSFLLLIVARLSILSFLIVVLIYLVFYSKINLNKKLIILSSLILIFTLFVCFNPKIKERVIYQSTESFIDNEPRFVIWQSVFNILNNKDYSYLLGYGNSNLIEEYLVINYEKNIENPEKREYFLHDRFDTHSQYFYFLLLGGFPALLLFSIYNIYSLYLFRKDFVSFSIFISFILFFLVENVFSNQLGCYLFLVYITYIFYYNKRTNFISNYGNDKVNKNYE